MITAKYTKELLPLAARVTPIQMENPGVLWNLLEEAFDVLISLSNELEEMKKNRAA